MRVASMHGVVPKPAIAHTLDEQLFCRERNDAFMRRKVTKFIQDTIAILVECRALFGELVLTAAAFYGVYQAFVRLTH
jgi:hypothetical protein